MRSELLLAIFYVAANAAWQPFALATFVRLVRNRLSPGDLYGVTLFAVVAASLLPFCSVLMMSSPGAVAPLRGPATATRTVTIVAVLYATLLLAAIARLGISLSRALRLRRSATADGAVLRGDVATPLTILSSIVVPKDFETWPPAVREWCLVHERAHVSHHDWWWSVAIRFLALPLSFHPAGRWLLRELETAREESRDVEAAGDQPLDYADALLFVAGRHAGAVALTLGAGCSLERRLDRLLRPALPSRPAAGLLATLAVVGIVFAGRFAAPHLSAAAMAGQWVNASGDLPVALELQARGEAIRGFVRFDAMRMDAERGLVHVRTDLLPVLRGTVEERHMQLDAPPALLSLEPISGDEAILRNRLSGTAILMKRAQP